MTKSGGFSEYLGIQFNMDHPNNKMMMLQPRLIKKILTVARFENCNPNRAAAAQVALDPPMKEM